MRARTRGEGARRVTERGRALGLVDDERSAHWRMKSEAIARGMQSLHAVSLSPHKWRELGFPMSADGVKRLVLIYYALIG